MIDNAPFDPDFDLRTDSKGPDPDALSGGSSTLRRYHRTLWSKALSDGTLFSLDTDHKYAYLHHTSAQADLRLSSDSIIHCYEYGYGNAVKPIAEQLPEGELREFVRKSYTIGAMILFPVNAYWDRSWAVNQARCMNARIKDRFDLKLECIRRHYHGETSPLSDVMVRYMPLPGISNLVNPTCSSPVTSALG